MRPLISGPQSPLANVLAYGARMRFKMASGFFHARVSTASAYSAKPDRRALPPRAATFNSQTV